MAKAEPQRPDDYVPTEEEIAAAVAISPQVAENPALLQAEFARQPKEAARWRWLRGEALGALEAQKAAIKSLENSVDRAAARARLRLKEGLSQKGAFLEDRSGRRVNAEDLEALVCNDGQVTIAADALTAALVKRASLEERLKKLEGACAGMDDKRDMLIQMGAQARAMMMPDPSIRDRR